MASTDLDLDEDSSDSESSDSESEPNEMTQTTATFKIPVNKLTLSPNTTVELVLSDKTIQTELQYIRHFTELTSKIPSDDPDESDSGSDDTPDNININAQQFSYEIYMKYSAELHVLCSHLDKTYTVQDQTRDGGTAPIEQTTGPQSADSLLQPSASVVYDVVKDMDENGIPLYCQTWIKSKKLNELETYVQSSTDTTNLSRLFGCASIQNFVSYWAVYLSIHKDIALQYCDEEYYNELVKSCNETVGVYNPERFKSTS
jgi:hypothetical protein